jgi:hypothetical protein
MKYRGVTPAVFRELQAAGKKRGFDIPGTPSGSFAIKVAGMQVGFQYAWDSRTGHLGLTCMGKPPLLSCSTIKSFADKIIFDSGGKAG